MIGITETWLTENKAAMYNISGYNHESKYKVNRAGGGVSLFIKEGLEYQLRQDLIIFNQIFESIFVEISKTQLEFETDIIVGVIYRPPNTDISVFNENLLLILSKVKKEKKLYIYWVISILTCLMLTNMILLQNF